MRSKLPIFLWYRKVYRIPLRKSLKSYCGAIFLLVLVFVFTKDAFCDQKNQAHALFYQGNTHYTEEAFEQAVAAYEGTLTLVLESGALYYNLANAYFKQDLPGKAVLNYLRAKRLMPRDADLKSNLDYAQSLIKGGIVVPQRNWFMRMFFKLAHSFSLDELTLLSSILYFILAALVILLIMVKRLRKIFVYITYPVLVALIICSSLFFVQFYQTTVKSQAVVIAETSDSRFEPFDDATTFFTLYEGESVIVGTTKGDWVKIKRIDGKQGWVKQSDIELL